MNLLIVKGLELGWDDVVAVYDEDFVTEDQLLEHYDPKQYVILSRRLYTEMREK